MPSPFPGMDPYIEHPLDLLRAGTRPPLARPVADAAYRIMLSRAERRPTVELWILQLRDPLPILPVPLRHPDADALLELPVVIAETYERGGYEQLISTMGATCRLRHCPRRMPHGCGICWRPGAPADS